MMSIVLTVFALAAVAASHLANPVVVSGAESGYDYR